MKSIITKFLMVGAAAAAIALPATAASAQTTNFAAQDNGGVLVTSQAVHVGEHITYQGREFTIISTHELGTSGDYTFRVTPVFADPRGALNFSVVG